MIRGEEGNLVSGIFFFFTSSKVCLDSDYLLPKIPFLLHLPLKALMMESDVRGMTLKCITSVQLPYFTDKDPETQGDEGTCPQAT